MKKLMREFKGQDVEFFTVYVREPHAGEARFWRYKQPRKLEEKQSNARKLVRQKKIDMPILVDDMDEEAHRRFGRMPNMCYLIDKQGRIAYKSMWTRPQELRQALQELVG